MSFRVTILRRAQKELASLPAKEYGRVRHAIRALGVEPRPRNSLKLVAREGRRVRVGNYRVIYEIDEKQGTVIVLHVGHRKDIYG